MEKTKLMESHSKTILAASVLVVGSSIVSFAAETPAASGDLAKGPTISVAEAVQIAEEAMGGKASAASLDAAASSAAYEVSLTLADGSSKSVLVDAKSGKLRSLSTDAEDNKENTQDGGQDLGQEGGQENGDQQNDVD